MTLRRLVLLAWKSLWLHRLRSALTVLGIVCGTGSVIAMLAVGEGESQRAQEAIRRLGSRNLLLASVPPAGQTAKQESNQSVLRYGLSRQDLAAIRATVPEISRVVPRRDVPTRLRSGERRIRAVVMGTTPEYALVGGLRLAAGRFLSPGDESGRLPVCVLGEEAAQRLFDNRNPVGRWVYAASNGYEVVGVLAGRGEGTGTTAGVGGESDAAIFIPWATMQERYGDVILNRTSGSRSREEVQVHRLTVEVVGQGEAVVHRVAGVLRALLAQRHPEGDVRLTVPLELLRQARETRERWTLILGTIASISLLVGGIGIMNIMLATVVERTREIGIRRALGARRADIILQFLAETVLLSVTGGMIGVGLGIWFPALITRLWGMHTVVAPWFLGLAFGISAALGVIFGLYPAVRASGLDPVEALRHD